MKYKATSTRLQGFSLLELLVAISLISILVSATSLQLSDTRARTRDANRKGSIQGYRGAMEQHFALFKTYYVGDVGYIENTPIGNKPEDFCTTNGSPTLGSLTKTKSCGWGRMTRRGIVGSGSLEGQYTPVSISDKLVEKGLLTSVYMDPKSRSFTDNYGDMSTYSDFNDFILTICDSQGNKANSPDKAKDYAIYTNLERSQGLETEQAKHLCGGPGTSKGWNLLR